MAFPSLGVVDNFDRSNTGPPLSANWTDLYNGTKVVSNQGVGTTGADSNVSLYETSYGPATECYVTGISLGGTGSSTGVFARCTTLNISTFDGYYVEVVQAATDTWSIYRVDNGTPTLLGATFTQAFEAGDSIGIYVTGSTIQAYYKSGAGAWAQCGTNRTDATYASAGYIGLAITGTDQPFDDFGGGTVVSGTTYPSSVSGALTPAGTLIKQSQMPRGGGLTPSGALTKRAGLPRMGVVATITGALSKQTNKLFAGALPSIVGTLSRAISTTKTGSVATITGALTKLVQVTRVGTITLSGALTTIRSVLMSLAGALTPVGGLKRETSTAKTGILTPVGGLTKQTRTTKTGGLTPSGILAAMKSALISLFGATTPVGILTRSVNKNLNGATTPTGSIIKRVGKILTGNTTPIGSLIAWFVTIFTGMGRVYLTLDARQRTFTLDTRSINLALNLRGVLSLDERVDALSLATRSPNLSIAGR